MWGRVGASEGEREGEGGEAGEERGVCGWGMGGELERDLSEKRGG